MQRNGWVLWFKNQPSHLCRNAQFWSRLLIGLSIPAGSCWYRSQGQSFTKQLDNGIRYFDIDTCFVDSGRWEHGPWTCHSSAYGGPIRKMLQQIDEWMRRNPTEVVIIKFGRDTVNSKAQKIGSEILKQVMVRYFNNIGGKSVVSFLLNLYSSIT